MTLQDHTLTLEQEAEARLHPRRCTKSHESTFNYKMIRCDNPLVVEMIATVYGRKTYGLWCLACDWVTWEDSRVE